jgi:hypothetical protein
MIPLSHVSTAKTREKTAKNRRFSLKEIAACRGGEIKVRDGSEIGY